MLPDRQQLCALIRNIAQQEIAPRFNRITHSYKADGSVLTEADLAVQSSLQQALQQQWPAYAFLGEEMPPAQQTHMLQTSEQGLWILDPIDGTSNFAAGIPHFGVSLALLIKKEIVLGIVYDPMRDECFSAVRAQGAWLNDEPIQNLHNESIKTARIGIVDYKRLAPQLAARLASVPPYSSQRSFGSVALDWCWLAAGRGHVYLHGKQNLWDFAAGWLIFTEAGGQSCTLQGEAVFNNTLTPRSALAALDKNMFTDWKEWVLNSQA